MVPYVDENGVAQFLAQQKACHEKNGAEAGYIHGRMDGETLVLINPSYPDEGEDRIEPCYIMVPTGVEGETKQIKAWSIQLGLTWERITEQRFMLLLPCNRELWPDLPPPMESPSGTQLVLWDRQEKAPVWVLFEKYAQAVCLEHGERSPFSALETWFNSLSNGALESEGLPISKEPYV
jgi:hypothetical protein